jgi:hypothetical protein
VIIYKGLNKIQHQNLGGGAIEKRSSTASSTLDGVNIVDPSGKSKRKPSPQTMLATGVSSLLGGRNNFADKEASARFFIQKSIF